MISVVIPTYNRSGILKTCLQRLEDQTLPKNEFEIIIIDDGSTDKTEEIVLQAQKKLTVHIRYYKQKNQGQGKARNFGIRLSNGDIIVFIGDDIFPKSNFLEQHLMSHKEHPEENAAILGYTTWHPELNITPFMHFLEHGGHQFAYDDLKNKAIANFHYFYTSNISLKRSLLSRHNFDESFKKYGWEDIELGYRLKKEENLTIYYNPLAVGYHYHEVKREDFREHMHAIGRNAHIFHKKHPELNKVPSFWKYLLVKLALNPISIGASKFLQRSLYYKLLTKKYYLEGLKEASER